MLINLSDVLSDQHKTVEETVPFTTETIRMKSGEYPVDSFNADERYSIIPYNITSTRKGSLCPCFIKRDRTIPFGHRPVRLVLR